MNLYQISSFDHLLDTHKVPKILSIHKVDAEFLSPINLCLRKINRNDNTLRLQGIPNRLRLMDNGWELIYKKDSGEYFMLVDFDHPKMFLFRRDMTLNSILN